MSPASPRHPTVAALRDGLASPLSISHLTALDASPEDFCRAAAAAGFGAVGLRINPPPHTPDQWPVAGDRARTTALRRLIDDEGLVTLECEGFGIRPGVGRAQWLAGLEAAAVLGSRFVLSPGIVADEERLVEGYAELCSAAREFGLQVGMEFISWNPMRTLADALRVHARVGADNAGVLVDFLHFARTGGTPEELAGISESALAYVQICDASAALAPGDDLAQEARTRRAYPGEGELPLGSYLAAIPAATRLTLEAPSARHAGLPAGERIRAAAKTCARWFAEHPARRPTH